MTTPGVTPIGGTAPAEARDLECQWMVPAVFSWLADERVRKIAIREKCATPHGIGILGGLLHMALSTGKPVDPLMLKRSVLDLVSNRKVRRRIAHLVLEKQADSLERDPLNAPPKKSARDVLSDLQDLRNELEAEFSSGIIRPF